MAQFLVLACEPSATAQRPAFLTAPGAQLGFPFTRCQLCLGRTNGSTPAQRAFRAERRPSARGRWGAPSSPGPRHARLGSEAQLLPGSGPAAARRRFRRANRRTRTDALALHCSLQARRRITVRRRGLWSPSHSSPAFPARASSLLASRRQEAGSLLLKEHHTTLLQLARFALSSPEHCNVLKNAGRGGRWCWSQEAYVQIPALLSCGCVTFTGMSISLFPSL